MSEVVPLMIGTAGHVDHGKTSLLARLSGGAPHADRLPEEQKRGLTIDIGYAELRFGDRKVGVVDVPGHEKFVHNMVAAASGIDLILLVVAADDGVMPQTREHLEIADLLGATCGVVALTKIDLVDEDLLELACEDVRELTAGTFLEDAPIVRVSSETGEGIDALRDEVVAALESAEPKTPEGIFRVPVQRSFTKPGHGTVITGVPLSGTVRVGDTLEIVPGGDRVRVRALQAYHEDVQEARAGHRTALKLSDVAWRDVRRGDVVAEPGFLTEANLVSARFTHLPRRNRALVSNTPIRFHTGTAEVLGRLFLLTDRKLAPGEEGLVQLRLDRAVVFGPGDRFVLRSPSPQVTLGGGRVIGASDVKISAGRSRLVNRVRRRERALADPESTVLFHLAEAGLVPTFRKDLVRLVMRRMDEIRPILDRFVADGRVVAIGEKLIDGDAVKAGRKKLVEQLDRFHRKEPLMAAAARTRIRDSLGVDDAVLDLLVSGEPSVEPVDGGRLRRAGYAPALSVEQSARLAKLEGILSEAPFATPRENELPGMIGATPDETSRLLEILFDDGRAVRLAAGVVLSGEALARAKETISTFIRENGPLGPADLKATLGMSRKYSIPLLEWLDSARFTMRQGDRRILVGEN
ncbi:MAG: selenocysteine-specific translation elongation factor [Planctomycetota bacterium]